MIRHRLAGIDMSSQFFDVCLFVSRASHRERFEADEAGFKAFGEWLKSLGVNRIWAGIEHTGGYERKLALHLLEKGHKVSLVDGLKINRFKEMLGKKSKTDKADAEVIAKFVKAHRPALWTPRPDVYEHLLGLKRHRDKLVENLTEWKNRRKGPKTNTFVHGQEETIIEVLQVQLKAVEEEIRTCIESDPELSRAAANMQSITGIAFTTAAAFLAESGPLNLQTYPTPQSLALAAGLAPLPWMSGVSVKGTYTKPYGNEGLRNALNMTASIARRLDPALGLFADRLEKRGKCKAVQVRAVKRKLVHIIWALVIHNAAYDGGKAVWNFKPKEA